MVVIKGAEYLSKGEFAREVNVCYTTVNNWVLRGIIKPAYIDGKNQYFTQEQLEAYWQGEYVPVRK